MKEMVSGNTLRKRFDSAFLSCTSKCILNFATSLNISSSCIIWQGSSEVLSSFSLGYHCVQVLKNYFRRLWWLTLLLDRILTFNLRVSASKSINSHLLYCLLWCTAQFSTQDWGMIFPALAVLVDASQLHLLLRTAHGHGELPQTNSSPSRDQPTSNEWSVKKFKGLFPWFNSRQLWWSLRSRATCGTSLRATAVSFSAYPTLLSSPFISDASKTSPQKISCMQISISEPVFRGSQSKMPVKPYILSPCSNTLNTHYTIIPQFLLYTHKWGPTIPIFN